MPTIRLYDQTPYETEFNAIIKTVEVEKKRTLITLNQTLFFPEEGGQECDEGTINGLTVTHVAIKDGVIIHTLKGRIEDLTPGMSVHGVIDWTHRFDQMQNHSAEHLVSGIVHNHFGYDNVGFHLSRNEMTVDYNGPLSDEDIRFVEDQVNVAITSNVAIKCEYPDPSKLPEIDYRSKLELTEDVRIVTVEGYDVCACCAPHVRTTGEIGQLRIIRWIRNKQGIRLWLIAGQRALKYEQKDFDNLTEIYHLLSANQTSVVKHVNRLNEENGQLKKAMHDMALHYMQEKVEQLKTQTHIYLFEDNLSSGMIRDMINYMLEVSAGYVGVFNGNDQQGYRYVIAAKSLDARTIGTLLRDAGGKGGGKMEMIQGFIKLTHDELSGLLPH
ncbi:MAG: alanyl-tRNA editing protein [Erysipelotrichaceae bacterium]|nr:alanyl-tRNA editing protein [Erysipelotrichaceae bacterium]